ncbi:MAG: hypothetical protein ABL898_00830 [Hyphomicrobiaceae bacterium]|nr:hypothetical protein [Hyphomicrobiaceae bacterium]
MRKIFVVSAVAFTLSLTGSALADSKRADGDRKGAAEQSQSHDERAEHAGRGDGRKGDKDRGRHSSRSLDRDGDKVESGDNERRHVGGRRSDKRS